jgi:hypothetical protein
MSVKFEGMSCEEIRIGFIDAWRTSLKNSIEEFEKALQLRQVHPQHIYNASKLIGLQKEALSKLEAVDSSVGDFGESLTNIAELTGMRPIQEEKEPETTH